MAGASAPFNGACKPHRIQQYWKRLNLLPLALLTSLCAASYFLGTSHHHGGGGGGGGGASSSSAVPCRNGIAAAERGFGAAAALDFAAHHTAGELDASAAEAREFPACDGKYSEYTPCEDRDRSLQFERERLVYRERHCPEKGELLKCLIPAPRGYRRPFPWPESRGAARFANVPHKELTVEKAVQNWIKVEGDKFVFPGGGTMFPNGADAYIDDIDRVVPLRDGSIRTAIDTGCGVASWGAYLLSRGILTMSLAPRDTHAAQVQFALERGVPAMIGVLASNRLPYPARAFDMAHCSRCLIPWHLYGTNSISSSPDGDGPHSAARRVLDPLGPSDQLAAPLEGVGENSRRSECRTIRDRKHNQEPLLEKDQRERRHRSLAKAHQSHPLQDHPQDHQIPPVLPRKLRPRRRLVRENGALHNAAASGA